MFIFACGEISAKIHMVGLAQHETYPSAASRKEGIAAEKLTTAWRHAADPSEANQTEPLRQDQAVFHLSRNHVTVEISAGFVSAQFIADPVNAVAVKGGLSAGGTEIRVIGEDLVLAQAPILVERRAVRLKGVLAAQPVCEEVGR